MSLFYLFSYIFAELWLFLITPKEPLSNELLVCCKLTCLTNENQLTILRCEINPYSRLSVKNVRNNVSNGLISAIDGVICERHNLAPKGERKWLAVDESFIHSFIYCTTKNKNGSLNAWNSIPVN